MIHQDKPSTDLWTIALGKAMTEVKGLMFEKSNVKWNERSVNFFSEEKLDKLVCREKMFQWEKM